MTQSLAGIFKLVYKGYEVSASRTWGSIQTSRVYIDNQSHGDFAKWELVPTSNDSEWYIRNVGAGDYACGQPSADTRIIGKEENKVAWRIERVDGNTYRIGHPREKLYWTAQPSATQIPGRVAWEIFLRAGGAEQGFAVVAFHV